MVGARRYKLSGDEKELAEAAPENSVTVTGDLDDNDLAVISVDWKGKQNGQK
jgi:hypothetical protein